MIKGAQADLSDLSLGLQSQSQYHESKGIISVDADSWSLSGSSSKVDNGNDMPISQLMQQARDNIRGINSPKFNEVLQFFREHPQILVAGDLARVEEKAHIVMEPPTKPLFSMQPVYEQRQHDLSYDDEYFTHTTVKEESSYSIMEDQISEEIKLLRRRIDFSVAVVDSLSTSELKRLSSIASKLLSPQEIEKIKSSAKCKEVRMTPRQFNPSMELSQGWISKNELSKQLIDDSIRNLPNITDLSLNKWQIDLFERTKASVGDVTKKTPTPPMSKLIHSNSQRLFYRNDTINPRVNNFLVDERPKSKKQKQNIQISKQKLEKYKLQQELSPQNGFLKLFGHIPTTKLFTQSARTGSMKNKILQQEFMNNVMQRTFNEKEQRKQTEKCGRYKSNETSKSKHRSTSQEKRGSSKPKKIDPSRNKLFKTISSNNLFRKKLYSRRRVTVAGRMSKTQVSSQMQQNFARKISKGQKSFLEMNSFEDRFGKGISDTVRSRKLSNPSKKTSKERPKPIQRFSSIEQQIKRPLKQRMVKPTSCLNYLTGCHPQSTKGSVNQQLFLPKENQMEYRNSNNILKKIINTKDMAKSQTRSQQLYKLYDDQKPMIDANERKLKRKKKDTRDIINQKFSHREMKDNLRRIV